MTGKSIFTFFTSPEHLPAVQRVVKAHGFRFEGNPASGLHLPILPVSVSYEGDDPQVWQQAITEIDAIIHPPTPPEPLHKGWFRRVREMIRTRSKTT